MIMSMVTAMMMVVGDHEYEYEYEYDDDTSDAGGEHFCVTVRPKHCCTVEGRQNRRHLTKHCCTVEKK